MVGSCCLPSGAAKRISTIERVNINNAEQKPGDRREEIKMHDSMLLRCHENRHALTIVLARVVLINALSVCNRHKK